MVCNTIREILVQTEAKFGDKDSVSYKVVKDSIESKTYSQLRQDSEHFSGALKEMGMQGKHVAVIGATSYEWILTYLGIVNCGSVAVPLDVALPPQEICELLNRADVSVLVYDEIRADVAAMAKEACPNLVKIISMQKKETGMSSLYTSFLQKVKMVLTSGLTRKSCVPLCLHQVRQERARALC